MKLSHKSLSVLAHALEARRGFTMGERAQADEILQSLRREACEALKIDGPQRRPGPDDSADEKRLKRAGLSETLAYLLTHEHAYQAELPVLTGLIRAALYDYANPPDARKAVPTSVKVAQRVRSEKDAAREHNDAVMRDAVRDALASNGGAPNDDVSASLRALVTALDSMRDAVVEMALRLDAIEAKLSDAPTGANPSEKE